MRRLLLAILGFYWVFGVGHGHADKIPPRYAEGPKPCKTDDGRDGALIEIASEDGGVTARCVGGGPERFGGGNLSPSLRVAGFFILGMALVGAVGVLVGRRFLKR